MGPLLIDLHQMVDMALATPEPGTINISILQALLHCFVHQLAVPSHRVEFHGANHDLIEQVVACIPHPSPVTINEFCVDDPNKLECRRAVERENQSDTIKTILTIDNNVITTNPPGFPLVPLQMISMTDLGAIKDQNISIHDPMGNALPGWDELFPVDDVNDCGSLKAMNRMLNTAKRIDAIEIGLRKLAKMVACVACQLACSENDDDDASRSEIDTDSAGSTECGRQLISEHIEHELQYELSPINASENHNHVSGDQSCEKSKIVTISKAASSLPLLTETNQSKSEHSKSDKSPVKSDNASNFKIQKYPVNSKNSNLKTDKLIYPESRLSSIISVDKPADESEELALSHKRSNTKYSSTPSKTTSKQLIYPESSLNSIMSVDKPADESEELAVSHKKSKTKYSFKDSANPSKTTSKKEDIRSAHSSRSRKLCKKDQSKSNDSRNIDLQDDIFRLRRFTECQFDRVFNKIEALKGDLNQLQSNIDSKTLVLSSRIDNTEITFAALVEAAQNQALSNLIDLQNLFLNTMVEVQDMLDAKVDKQCIPQLKEYITKCLNQFQDTLEYFRKEFGMVSDAAGTTAVLLRNLNCVSCSKNVNQKDRENPPYMPLMTSALPGKARTADRYCGGSHTKTTPDERYLRKGNFAHEYGDAGPNLTVQLGTGSDGKLYRTKAACPCGPCFK